MFAACQRFSRQFPLHRANEPLHAPVLPRAPRLDALVPNAQHPQAQPEQTGDQYGFIVCPQKLWSARLLHRLHQFRSNVHDDLSDSRCNRKQARLP